MKIKSILISVFILGGLLFSSFLKAQTANSLYFLDRVVTRHNLNPAFAPAQDLYLDLPILSGLYLEGSLGNLTASDIFKQDANGQTISLLSPGFDLDQFYQQFDATAVFSNSMTVNLLGFGWRHEKNYFHVGITLHEEMSSSFPKDLFKFLAYGTPIETGDNLYNFSGLSSDAEMYLATYFGFTQDVNEQLSLGAKVKLLTGLAYYATDINTLSLSASRDQWDLYTDGEITGAFPIEYTTVQNADGNNSVEFDSFDVGNNILSPKGWGVAFDLGATYRPFENLELSAALLDFGFINWNKDNERFYFKGHHTVDKLALFNTSDDDSYFEEDPSLENLGDEIKETFQNDGDADSDPRMITATANLGAEYFFMEEKLSVGALYSNRMFMEKNYKALTLSLNMKPVNWWQGALSYGINNYNCNSLGLAMNFDLGYVNLYFASDYIDSKYSKITDDGSTLAYLPQDNSYANVQIGLNFIIREFRRDHDHDGVRDRRDLCPNTDFKHWKARCQNADSIVDLEGCLLDEDKDGIPDCYDQCALTPEGVVIDSVGCPLDDDVDGVPNYRDECPNTPQNIEVDSLGCPFDSDKDGIYDYLDQCPNTPIGAPIDSVGCPLDDDQDGVINLYDKCPNTPQGAPVDSVGCPLDSDQDGVIDLYDECPNTPQGLTVDAKGCLLDTDQDGVLDSLDRCPEVPGSVDNNGCPIISKEIQKVFKSAMQGVQFYSGTDKIKPSSFKNLDAVVKVMIENPTFYLNLQGYTDNVGQENYNLTLSEKRAKAVKVYLEKKGIEGYRLSTQGYGEADPIASNKTSKGRAQNRRVEFHITFTKTVTVEEKL